MKKGMNEAIRAMNREGMKGIEAAPGSIVGLGDGAVTSAAATITVPTIIITTAKRAADVYLPAPAILAHTHNACYSYLMWKSRNPKHNSCREKSETQTGPGRPKRDRCEIQITEFAQFKS